jgi:hypothetical protein
LYWMSRALTVGLREKRMEYAQTMMPFLNAAERDYWHHLVTGDESWFFLDTALHRLWTLSRDNVITKPRHDIQSKEFMFTVIWNLHGFHVVNKFPNNIRINSNYFVIKILNLLEEAIFPRGRTVHQKRLIVHLDNCSADTSQASTSWLEEHNIHRMSHTIRLIWPAATSICFLQ